VSGHDHRLAMLARVPGLPVAPLGRSGWPWSGAEEPAGSPQDGRPWPRITVVTPSYNQVEYLEETIRSVLLQGYPNLEYVIIDGGSTDGSVGIIEEYSPWLSFWCSEPDRGQSHAINKGFERATGDILGWINSDDIFYPGALHAAAEGLSDADLFLGGMVKVRREGSDYVEVKRSTPYTGQPIHHLRILADGPRHAFHFYQPSLFWRRGLWEKTGALDERYHYVMDVEWCNRALAQGARVSLSVRPLARFLLHEDSKSVALEERFSAEWFRMYLRLSQRPEFRFLPCLVASLRPAQTVLGYRAASERADGNRATAWWYRISARAVKLLRRVLGGEGSIVDGQEEVDA
jgi:glycosyltransferase involved in cell wall biosynthesis